MSNDSGVAPAPYVATNVPPRGASDDEVREWAETFAQRMIAAERYARFEKLADDVRRILGPPEE